MIHGCISTGREFFDDHFLKSEGVGMSTKTANSLDRIGGQVPTNGAAPLIELGVPYIADVQLRGSSDLLMHAWNVEAVGEKAKAAKGSKAKKSDDIKSYVYRLDNGELALPGEYLRQSMINAAKFRQDPRSPRKSAMDLYKAALVVDPQLASLGVTEWDYLDTRRAVVQRNGINRTRPAMRAGWRVTYSVTVLLPEYVALDALLDVISTAGRLTLPDPAVPFAARLHDSKIKGHNLKASVRRTEIAHPD